MVPANKALNFIMVTIIKNGYHVILIKNGIYRKWFRIQAPDGPNGTKRGTNGTKRGPYIVLKATLLAAGLWRPPAGWDP